MKPNTLLERVILTVFMILLTHVLFCQENYLTGYIIQINGDTLHGMVDYRNWGLNPDKISFKTFSGGKAEYSPMNIKGFGVLDEVYESAIIQTEVSPENISDLTEDPSLVLETDTTFLQAMVLGRKSLYFYKNRNDKEQFYIKQDTSYEFLVHKKFRLVKEKEGIIVIAENKVYIGQLTLYLYDCPSIQSKLKTLKYNRSSLEKLFLNYYDCVNSEIKFHKETAKVSAEFGILAGMSLTQLKFSNDDYVYLVYTDYPLSVNFSGGLFLDVIMPRNNGKWSIYNELIYSSYKVSGYYEDYHNENYYTKYNTTLGLSYIKLNNMLRYKYPAGKLFIYANAGISNGYAISITNYLKTDWKFYNSEGIEESAAIEPVRKYELGLLFGLGTKYKNYSIDVRYERGTGVSLFDALRSSTNRFYFLVGYRF